MGTQERTCIGCRRKRPRSELVRIVLRDGIPMADVDRILPGRGAWLCPRRACFGRAEKKGALRGAFRRMDPPPRGGGLMRIWSLIGTDP